jgi:hypothetical protein
MFDADTSFPVIFVRNKGTHISPQYWSAAHHRLWSQHPIRPYQMPMVFERCFLAETELPKATISAPETASNADRRLDVDDAESGALCSGGRFASPQPVSQGRTFECKTSRPAASDHTTVQTY